MEHLHLFLEVIPALAVIIGVARLCGRLIMFVGQPRVVGEMVSGVLLGPTLFGWLAPDMAQTLFPDQVKAVLFVLSNIGLSIYMFLVGMEMDLKSLRGNGMRHASALAVAGVLPAFALGFVAAWVLHPVISLPDVSPGVFAFFMGCAVSITAFPMLARILQEKGLTKTRIGSLSLLSASMVDAVAWCLLALVTAIATAKGAFSSVYTLLGGFLFAAVMFLIIKPLFRWLGDQVERKGTLSQGDLAIVLLMLLAAAWFTDYIGIFSVFGGFITGLVMPRTPTFQQAVHQRLFDFNVVFLLPIFFAYSGLNTKLDGLFSLTLLLPFLVILSISIIGKYGSCLVTMRSMGFSWRESSAIGGLMNARGLMELILINVGLTYGMISRDVFSMLVLMAIVTTAMAMPIYSWSLPPQHEKRLAALHGGEGRKNLQTAP